MKQPIFQVDAFTDTPFAGNPAAVCVLPTPRDDTWMQAIAREMNLSETAFLFKQDDGFNLRWFTPTVEVDLCGHATLASAHVLWEAGHLAPQEQARFHTRSGLLTAERNNNWIMLNFPIRSETPAAPPPGFIEALGVTPRYIGKSADNYLVEVESEAEVCGLTPDYASLRALAGHGIIVTSRANTPPYDFVSRYFAPAIGIDEDPVTGSAHCTLGPFWRERLGKSEFVAYQASERGGVVRVRLAGERVELGGQAVTVLRGDLIEGR